MRMMGKRSNATAVLACIKSPARASGSDCGSLMRRSTNQRTQFFGDWRLQGLSPPVVVPDLGVHSVLFLLAQWRGLPVLRVELLQDLIHFLDHLPDGLGRMDRLVL
jgi:hypothetical protein